MMWIEDWLGTI